MLTTVAAALFAVSCGSAPAATVAQTVPFLDDTVASSAAPTQDQVADTGDPVPFETDEATIPVASQETLTATSPDGHGVEQAPWASNVSVTVDVEGIVRLQSDGLPSHEIDALIGVPGSAIDLTAANAQIQANSTRAQVFDFVLPADPVWSDAVTPTPFGAIGVLVSGAALFNPYEAGGGVALDTNFEIDGAAFIDACNGHPDENGTYHYHGVPYCITDAVDTPGEHSVMIGLLLDGYPVYGPQDLGGATPTDLDVCKGHFGPTPEFPDGTYHYHLLESGTYSIDCFHGVVQRTDSDHGETGAAPGGGAAPVDAENERRRPRSDDERDASTPRPPDPAPNVPDPNPSQRNDAAEQPGDRPSDRRADDRRADDRRSDDGPEG